MRWPVRIVTSQEKKCTPACRRKPPPRSKSPSMREPFTWSARSSMIGRDEHGDLLGQVLAVGVERDDDVGAELQRDVVADAQRHAAAATDRQGGGERAGHARGVGGAVVGVVVDHDRHDMVARDLLWHRLDDRPRRSRPRCRPARS